MGESTSKEGKSSKINSSLNHSTTVIRGTISQLLSNMNTILVIFTCLLMNISSIAPSSLNDAYSRYQPPGSDEPPDEEESKPVDVIVTYPQQTINDAHSEVTRFIENCESTIKHFC